MSCQNKKQGLRAKTIMSQISFENDITNQEFDDYYQRCLQKKRLRIVIRPLEEEKYFDEDYEDILTVEEIDRAFEEAEKWSDF